MGLKLRTYVEDVSRRYQVASALNFYFRLQPKVCRGEGGEIYQVEYLGYHLDSNLNEEFLGMKILKKFKIKLKFLYRKTNN